MEKSAEFCIHPIDLPRRAVRSRRCLGVSARFISLLAGLLAVAAHLAAADTIPEPAHFRRVGLTSFRGEGYTPVQLQTLTLRFQDEVFRRKNFELVEQAEMQAVIAEKGLEEAGCTRATCLVEMGRTVGISHVVIPSIMRVGSIATLQARMVDVATGKVVRLAVLDTKKKFERIVGSELAVLAGRIVGGDPSKRSAGGLGPDSVRTPVAVLDVRGFGIDTAVAKGLTSRFRGALFNVGVFEVMERDEMVEILKEQGLQQSGVCEDENCLVEAGQMIGVRNMVGGGASRIERMYSVSARLIDVESGKILRTATADVKGDIERVMKETMPDMARAISGMPVYRRVNVTALGFALGAVALAGVGGYYTLAGYREYNDYRAEKYDVDAVLSHRDATTRNMWVSYGFYGGAGVLAGVALYSTISGRVKLRVDQTAGTGPGVGVGLTMEMR